MSYSIRYGSPEPGKRKKKNSHMGLIGAVLILLICALAAGWSMPEEMQRIHQVLFPWAQPAVQEAFAEFEEDVSRGQPFGDALTAFCQEILNDAESTK